VSTCRKGSEAVATIDVEGLASRPPAGVLDGHRGARDKQLRVAIYDAHPLFVDGMAETLVRSGGFDVIIRATTSGQLLHALERTPVDVVLLEPWGQPADGIDSIVAIRERLPSTAIVAISCKSEPRHVNQAVANGAQGYVTKDTRGSDLPSLIHLVAEGSTVLPSGTSNGAAKWGLTRREAEVLALAARGSSNAAIGRALFITERTVKFHLRNVNLKIGASNRTEAAHQALHHGLIS